MKLCKNVTTQQSEYYCTAGKLEIKQYLFYLLAQSTIHTIISTDINNMEIVLIGQKGSMSTYRCP